MTARTSPFACRSGHIQIVVVDHGCEQVSVNASMGASSRIDLVEKATAMRVEDIELVYRVIGEKHVITSPDVPELHV